MTHDVLFATAAQTAANPPWAFQGTAAAAYPIRHCQSSRTCLWFEAVSVPCGVPNGTHLCRHLTCTIGLVRQRSWCPPPTAVRIRTPGMLKCSRLFH